MNKQGPSVRQRGGVLARSLPSVSRTSKRRQAEKVPDRRVHRTRRALIQALVALVLEKRYDRITIQDLLDRADVGRSTFYAHFRGKDDLLLQSFEQMLEGLDECLDEEGASSRRVAPVRELFRHIGEFGSFHRALARARMQERLYQAGTTHMSRTIARRLDELRAGRGGSGVTVPVPAEVPVPVMAQALAGALFALLAWWIEHDAPYTPEQMDAMYHAIRLTT